MKNGEKGAVGGPFRNVCERPGGGQRGGFGLAIPEQNTKTSRPIISAIADYRKPRPYSRRAGDLYCTSFQRLRARSAGTCSAVKVGWAIRGTPEKAWTRLERPAAFLAAKGVESKRPRDRRAFEVGQFVLRIAWRAVARSDDQKRRGGSVSSKVQREIVDVA